MLSVNRRGYLKATAGAATVGITGLAGCLGGDDSSLGLNYVVPFENYPYFFDVPEIADQLDNYGGAYELTVNQDSSTVDSLNAMAAGEIDMALVTTESYANAILGDVIPDGITAILVDFWDAHPDYFGFEIYSLPDSDITEPEDLEGQRLGLNALGTGVHAVYLRMLQDVGIDPEDVDFVEQQFPTFVPALEDDIMDVAIFVSQFATEPRADDYNLVFSSQDLYDEALPFGYIVVNNETLDEDPDAVEAFAEDYNQLIGYTQNNRDEVISLSAEHSDVPEEYLDPFLFTENDWYREELEFDFDQLQLVMDELYDTGIVDEQFDVDEYATNEYLP